MMVAEPGPAEQAERHDGMEECMQKMGEQPSVLSVEERNLLSIADKSAFGSRSAAWRFITSVEYKEKIKGNKRQAAHTREHAVTVEAELQKICDGILALMDKNLVASESSGESNVFYHTVKGDCNRYLAKFATGDAKSKVAEDARETYAEATKIVEKDLVVTSPIHLDTVLYFSVFQCEVLHDLDETCKMGTPGIRCGSDFVDAARTNSGAHR